MNKPKSTPQELDAAVERYREDLKIMCRELEKELELKKKLIRKLKTK